MLKKSRASAHIVNHHIGIKNDSALRSPDSHNVGIFRGGFSPPLSRMAHHRSMFNSQFSKLRFGFLPDRTSFSSRGSLTGLRPCPRRLRSIFIRTSQDRPILACQKRQVGFERLWSCESFFGYGIKKVARMTKAAITLASKIKDLKFVSPLIVSSYQGLALSPPFQK